MKYLEKEEALIEKTKENIKQIIDRQLRDLVSWDPSRSFIELELELCKRLNEIGALLLETLIPQLYGDGYVGSRKDIDAETSYRCECRNKVRSLKTVFGQIKLSRAVYSEYYSGGQKSFLDERIGIEDKKTDPLIKYWTDLLGTIAPFEEAADILNKIRGIKVSAKQTELSTEKTAKIVTESHRQDVREIMLDKKDRVPSAKINLNLNSERIIYMETDGCHINTENGWKECKTFMLFEIEKTSDEKYRLKNKFYYSTMNEVGDIKRQLKYHLERYCDKNEVKIVCIGDGAKWIWNTCEELFPKKIYPSGIIEIIDFYHAIEKTGDIKNEIFKNKEAGDKFYNECKEYLKKGNIEMIQQILMKLRDEQTIQEKKEFVDERLQYFEKNKNRMRYEKFREQGLCIGSGAIESANKYVVQRRVKLQGMIWKEENANYMVHLRAEYINGKMDEHYRIRNNPLMTAVAVT